MKILEKIKSNYILIAIVVIGAALRLYHIDFQSFWLDEIHTLNVTNPTKPFSTLYDSILTSDSHPPLYFYILYILLKIFGYSTMVLRLFSAVLGIAAIVAIYKLGKELQNKHVGLIAALLLSVNSYHIYYSQEARLYTLLCFFTILSFLYLVRYLKMPTRRNAILYGVFTGLMLHGHFFALLGLLSQIFILLFFFVILEKEKRKSFLINSLISGAIVTIFFLPAIKLFIASAKIKGFWIPAPTPDVYTLIFKEFFGNSEEILCLVGLAIVLYFVRLAKENNSKISYDGIVENKTILNFIVFAFWITIILIVPLIRSYMSIPMIISRYFINILPAVILIVSIGIFQFKNQIVKVSVVALLFVFSITDLTIIKKYYTSVNKTQFREISQFIKDNNQSGDPIATSLPWHFDYFLNDKNHKATLIDSSLDGYVQQMMQDSTKAKPFWYVDAHNRPYKVTEETQRYLDKKFVIESSSALLDTWAKHYVIASNTLKKVDLSAYKPLKDSNGKTIDYYFEKYAVNPDYVEISGWGFLRDQDAKNVKIDIVIVKDNVGSTLFTQQIKRDDVTEYLKSTFDIGNSGFSANIPFKYIPSGKYRIGILIKDLKTNEQGFVLTDKFFDK